MKHNIYVLAMLCLATNVYSQEESAIRPVSIGDSITLPVPDWNKKAVLLDFFGTSCLPCIRNLPALDSIQHVYQDSLHIIAVTKESSDVINEFRKRNATFASVGLPFIYGDTILSRQFPYNMLPQTVWVYKGVVRAVSYAETVNTENLKKFIAGKILNHPVKADKVGFDYNKNLLTPNPDSDIVVVKHVALYKYIPGLKTGVWMNITPDSLKKVFFHNLDLYFLFASSSGISILSDKIDLIGNNTSKYRFTKSQPYFEWAPENAFCFEMTFPANTPEKVWRKQMFDLLNIWSPLTGTIKDGRLILQEKPKE